MSDITKKFDFSGIVDSVKSMINPEGNTPNPDPNDAIGIKIAKLSTMAQQLATTHAEQSRQFADLNKLLNGLYDDIEALRNPPEADSSTEDTVEEETKETEKAE